ncbi:MAG: aminopeptidase P family N-terminal domain-containing protein, partial [Acidobacteria bacterium]|nr:aminopeptidase P family N-terminal domain-containing protein [Acidobacteriota bacterium]
MRSTSTARRRFLKGGVVAGAAALAGWPPEAWGRSGAAAGLAGSDGKYPLPPELNVLNSKAYGRRRIRKFQDAVRKAGLDALIISNRALQYVGYVTNYHPSSMQPGVVLVPAEGAPILFVQMYSSAHARVARRTMWVDEVVDVKKDPVSESSVLNFYSELTRALTDRKLTRGRLGVAGGEWDWFLPAYFRERLPDAKTEDANRLLWSRVATRDEVELAILKWTSRLSDEVA